MIESKNQIGNLASRSLLLPLVLSVAGVSTSPAGQLHSILCCAAP